MKISKQAVSIVSKMQVQLTETFGAPFTEPTARLVAEESGFVETKPGRYGGVSATPKGLTFAGLPGAVAENPAKLEAERLRAGKLKAAADAALQAATAAMEEYKAVEAKLAQADSNTN